MSDKSLMTKKKKKYQGKPNPEYWKVESCAMDWRPEIVQFMADRYAEGITGPKRLADLIVGTFERNCTAAAVKHKLLALGIKVYGGTSERSQAIAAAAAAAAGRPVAIYYGNRPTLPTLPSLMDAD